MLQLLLPSPLLNVPHASQGRMAVSSAARVTDLQMVDPEVAVGLGIGALAAVGGGYFYTQKKDSPAPAPASAPPPVPVAAAPSPSPTASSWGTLPRGPNKGLHRGAGRAVPPPVREVFVPPAGWKPPTKPVSSWYDKGLRLVASAPPAAAVEEKKKDSTPANPFEAFFRQIFKGSDSAVVSVAKGPTGWGSLKRGPNKGLHRGAGRAVPPPQREVWTPPASAPAPAKKAATGSVTSWYDSGKRL